MKAIRYLAVCALLALCLTGAALAQETCPLVGDWAYAHEPSVSVLLVREDGTARYQGTEYTWTAEAPFLRLQGKDGTALSLRFQAGEDGVVIYPATTFQKTREETQPGLIGIWEGTGGSGSSFVFTPAGYFLEDSVFSGQYMINEAQGTFLLHYGDVFADTLCYYSLDDQGLMTVEYPFPVVPRE